MDYKKTVINAYDIVQYICGMSSEEFAEMINEIGKEAKEELEWLFYGLEKDYFTEEGLKAIKMFVDNFNELLEEEC